MWIFALSGTVQFLEDGHHDADAGMLIADRPNQAFRDCPNQDRAVIDRTYSGSGWISGRWTMMTAFKTGDGSKRLTSGNRLRYP